MSTIKDIVDVFSVQFEAAFCTVNGNSAKSTSAHLCQQGCNLFYV